MAHGDNRDSPSKQTGDQHFKDRIESLSEIRYEISVILMDGLGLQARAWLKEVERAGSLVELRGVVFSLQDRLIKAGKKELAREILAMWKEKTGY